MPEEQDELKPIDPRIQQVQSLSDTFENNPNPFIRQKSKVLCLLEESLTYLLTDKPDKSVAELKYTEFVAKARPPQGEQEMAYHLTREELAKIGDAIKFVDKTLFPEEYQD